jgi:hypothetical protein
MSSTQIVQVLFVYFLLATCLVHPLMIPHNSSRKHMHY